LALAFVFVASCVTVNIYFPAAAIQEAADKIVEDVRKNPAQKPGQTPEQSPAAKPDKSSRLSWIRLVRFGPAEAEAAMDINVSTPAIRSLQASMAGRFPQLQPFYAKNAIGETNTGLLALQNTAALSLKERADVTRLVEQENRDRQALYAEILRANNLDMGRVGEVQRLFANSWRGKSSPGWLIQLDSGQWVRK
jgi:uncharacterized protein YdbL (DUF1318 family)